MPKGLALLLFECRNVWHCGIGNAGMSGIVALIMPGWLSLKQQNIYFLFTMILRTKLPKTDPKIDPKIDPKTSITLAMFECKLQKHWECRNVKHSSIGVESVKTLSKVAYLEAMLQCKTFKHWECCSAKRSNIGNVGMQTLIHRGVFTDSVWTIFWSSFWTLFWSSFWTLFWY